MGMHPEDRAEWSRQQAEAAPDYTHLFSRSHKARKEHRCDFCHAKIEPGQRYKVQGGLVDGKFEMVKHHVACPVFSDA